MAFNFLDPRGFNTQVDYSGLGSGIGQLIAGQIANRLATKAEGGDQGALAKLSGIDPNRASTLGNLLRTQELDAQRQKEMEIEAAAQRESEKRELMGRIARGYNAANDKKGYLAAAAENMQRAGYDDVSEMIMVDLQNYDQNPAEIDQQYYAAGSIYGNDPSGAPAQVEYLKYLTQGMSPEDQEQARRVAAGLQARAPIDASEYGKREQEKLTAQKGLKAEVEGEVKAAQTKAEMDASGKTAEAADKKQRAYDLTQEAAKLAKEIAGDDRLEKISGVSRNVYGRVPTNVDLVTKAKRLEALLTTDNLKLMSGVLTDRDVQFLTLIGSGLTLDDLGFRGSKKGVQDRLSDIAKRMEKRLANQKPVKESNNDFDLEYNPVTGEFN